MNAQNWTLCMYICMYLANGLLHIKVFLTDKQNTVLSVSVCTDNFKRNVLYWAQYYVIGHKIMITKDFNNGQTNPCLRNWSCVCLVHNTLYHPL